MTLRIYPYRKECIFYHLTYFEKEDKTFSNITSLSISYKRMVAIDFEKDFFLRTHHIYSSEVIFKIRIIYKISIWFNLRNN